MSSLSGDITDYQHEASTPGNVVISAVHSYKERFRKGRAEHAEVLKEHDKMKEDREMWRRTQLYTRILEELHDLWFIQLPEDVQWQLECRGMLPDLFVSWLLQWEEAFPSDFPVPPLLHHFGPVKLYSQRRFIFYRPGQESNLSMAIHEAWDILPETVRQLMLFSWAGLQSVPIVRNNVAHPKIKNSTAKDILNHDL